MLLGLSGSVISLPESYPSFYSLCRTRARCFIGQGERNVSTGSGSTWQKVDLMEFEKTANRSNRVADVANPSSGYLAAAFGAVAASARMHSRCMMRVFGAFV